MKTSESRHTAYGQTLTRYREIRTGRSCRGVRDVWVRHAPLLSCPLFLTAQYEASVHNRDKMEEECRLVLGDGGLMTAITSEMVQLLRISPTFPEALWVL